MTFNRVRQALWKPSWHRSSVEPVLGTRFTLQVLCSSEATARLVSSELLREIERLEGIFSVYQPQSTLSQWKNSTAKCELSVAEAPELTEVLALANRWRLLTGGCFNPLADLVTQRWREAGATQTAPGSEELQALIKDLEEPRYVVHPQTGNIRKIGDCSSLSLHAIAKGWIVDRAAELAMRNGKVAAVLVNIGGDLRLCGVETTAVSTIAIENPLRAYDNEPPLCRIQIASGALATSGGSRRGFTIDGQWYGHVVDPRTAHPVDRVASASVYAPDATTADAIATMLSVVAPVEGLAFAEALLHQGTLPPGTLGCLIVDAQGQLFSNHVWDALTVKD